MIFLLCLIAVIPVTIQRSLSVNPCLDRYDPSCRLHEQLYETESKDLIPILLKVVYPTTIRKHSAEYGFPILFTNTEFNGKKLSSKGKKKKLFLPAVIIGASVIISSLITKQARKKKTLRNTIGFIN